MPHDRFTIGSLFSCTGALDLAVEYVTGGGVRWFAEAERYRRAILRRHWPKIPIFEDVADVGRDTACRVDLVCGGFVCKDISDAGPRTGIGGARSGGTWAQFVRVLGELRPRYAFVENSAALARRGLDTVLADLATLGYDARWTTLCAHEVGAPFRGERIFVLAATDDDRFEGLRERYDHHRHHAPRDDDARRSEAVVRKPNWPPTRDASLDVWEAWLR